MPIIVYNRNVEDHSANPNNYPIYRGSILGNPYTDIKDRRTKALWVVNTREEAIEKYGTYFDVKYSGDTAFKAVVDDIYEKFKNGEDVYLECYCKPLPCHGDLIAKKLQQRLIKEKIAELKNAKKG